MPSRFEDEKHWRKRAERMRALAASMPAAQQSILMSDLAWHHPHDVSKCLELRRRCGTQLNGSIAGALDYPPKVTSVFLVVASFGQGLTILLGGIDLSIGAVVVGAGILTVMQKMLFALSVAEFYTSVCSRRVAFLTW
jgi:hypothetical protein